MPASTPSLVPTGRGGAQAEDVEDVDVEVDPLAQSGSRLRRVCRLTSS
jgi:hypothetical protein